MPRKKRILVPIYDITQIPLPVRESIEKKMIGFRIKGIYEELEQEKAKQGEGQHGL